jgi:simple sugar transport system permease protein
MGWLIARFRLQPFIVTLAGMFLARGLCYLISIDSISITDPWYAAVSQIRIPVMSGASLSLGAVIALVVLAAAVFVAHYTPFGRTIYAVGGNPHSALLMGLPVNAATIGAYALSGFCSALGGVLFTFYMLSGYGLHAMGLELDAIASVVIGGTLLTGGVDRHALRSAVARHHSDADFIRRLAQFVVDQDRGRRAAARVLSVAAGVR